MNLPIRPERAKRLGAGWCEGWGAGMTPEVKEFVRKLGLTGKCLDVGSMDINGSIRDLFADYTGLDARPGRNVDVVASGHALPFADETFDVVTCLEMLEHDRDPARTLWEIRRVLKVGGTIVVTVPGIGFPKHNYPDDYWRVTGAGLKVWLSFGFEDVVVMEDRDHAYGWGKRE